MDYLNAIPLIVSVISHLSCLALEALAERLLTIVLAGFLVGGVALFAAAALAWLGLKRLLAELHPPRRLARP